MAGFLRKKNKESQVKPVPSAPIPLIAATQPVVPPLFARFATTNKSENAVPLIVSSPKGLSSNVRKEIRQPTQTVNGGAKKRSSVQTKQPPLTPPTPILNKPLPPPSPPLSAADPSGSTPTQSFNNKQTRPPPPSVFKNQPLNGQLVDSRSTSFSSVQTSNSSPTASRRPQDTSNNSLTSPQKRNPSTTLSSNNVLPPHQNQTLPPIANKKTMMTQQNPLPPPPQPTFGRQNNNLLLPSTNTSAAQTQLTASSLANHQDLHPANAAAAAVNMSMTKIGGAASTQMDINAQGITTTQVSDRNLDVDLPPEFAAMFHNFNQQFNLEDRNSVVVQHHSNTNNNDEHVVVPASNVPRSPDGSTKSRRPLIKTDQQERQEQILPPLPPPKSSSEDMGVASSSHVNVNGLASSSTKDFYSPRVVNGKIPPSPTTANQQSKMVKRRHSPPLPIPSVTSSASSTLPPTLPLTKQQQQQQDVLVKFPPRNNDLQPPFNKTTTHRFSSSPHSQNPSSSPPTSPRKSHQQQQQGSPVVGKPRIFAMTTKVVDVDVDDDDYGLDREETRTASSFSSGSPPPPPYVQYSAVKKQQQQQQQPSMHVVHHHQQQQSPPPQPQRHHHQPTMHVHQQQQSPPPQPQPQSQRHRHQPSATERRKSSTNNGNNDSLKPHVSVVVQPQLQQASTPPPPQQQQQQQQSHPQPQRHHHHHHQQQQLSATERRKSSTNNGNGSVVVQPHPQPQQQLSTPPPPFKFPQNHNNVELPPTPPSHNRGGSREPLADNDERRQSTLVNGSRKNSKSDNEEEEVPPPPRRRPQSQLVASQPRSRKDSKSEEQQQQRRPQSQLLLQIIRSRKNSKLDEELPPRPDSKSDEQRPRTPSRTRKLSKPRVNSQYSSNNNNNNDAVVLPGTPDSQHQQQHRHRRSMSSIRTLMTRSRPSSVSGKQQGVAPLEPAIQLDEDTKSKAGNLLLDDDPFARMEGVTMLTTTPPINSIGVGGESTLGEKEEVEEAEEGEGEIVVSDDEKKRLEIMKYPSISSLNSSFSVVVTTVAGSEKSGVSSPPLPPLPPPAPNSPPPPAPAMEGDEGVVVKAPPTPVSPPEEHRKSIVTKKKKKKTKEAIKEKKETKETKEKRLDDDDNRVESTFEPMLDNSESAAITTTTASATSTATSETTTAAAAAAEDVPEIELEPEPVMPAYTIIDFLSDPQLLSSLLNFFTFYDWCLLSSLSKEIRILLVQSPVLRETVLERFLKRTVGYSRWVWDDADPLQLSLQDLNDYMRGVSTPTHEYARIAGMYVQSLTIHPNHRDPSLIDIVRILTASTRAYTRVVLRLRAQAEKEAILAQQSRGLGITTMKQQHLNFNNSSYYPPSSPGRNGGGGNHSRVSSRAPSPTTSNGAGSSSGGMQDSTTRNSSSMMGGGGLLTFRSPLFRLRRAPLLRVFVPSPEGDWLSDKSVLACEEECKRAGVMHLIRLGDVVWDVAVGDEGNVGRLVWDGSYLIDLDYTYTSIGDLPKYIPALAFPPSYFHRVIRTGPIISNPIVHVDISPWGEEIAMNLQLLQDRVRTETPQGAYHNVVRWVHRSSFVIRPGPARFTTTQQGGKPQFLVSRIPIPDTDNNLFVDSGWHGTVVVETEGTNEALADLQERCGPGVFPPRSSRGVPQMSRTQIENKKVFRVLREKSRPGEIWIKTVGIKERIM